MTIRCTACALTIATLFVACDRPADLRGEAAEQREYERRERVQAEDKLPAHDQRKERVFKVGARFLVVPSEYARSPNDHILEFFWVGGGPVLGNKEVKIENKPGRSYKEQAVEIFLLSFGYKGAETDGPASTREAMEAYDAKGWLDQPIAIFPGVTRREVNRKDAQSDTRAFCVAENSMGLDGRPAVMMCPGTRSVLPVDVGGTAFVWKPGINVAVRIHSQHLRDWPKINAEIIRVLGFIRESAF